VFSIVLLPRERRLSPKIGRSMLDAGFPKPCTRRLPCSGRAKAENLCLSVAYLILGAVRAGNIHPVFTVHPAKFSRLRGAGKLLLTKPTLASGSHYRALVPGLYPSWPRPEWAGAPRARGSNMAKKAKAGAKDAEAEVEEQPAEGAEQPPKKRFSLKLVLMAAGALAVVIGGGAGAWAVLGPSKEAKPAAPVAKPVTFFDLPEVLVNLSNAGNDRTQYLKIKMTLELADAALIAQIQPVMPRVLDTFQTYLRELRPSDLDGSAGLYRLKEEMTRRVNAAIAPSKVNALLFREIVIQ
jgi:flagellar FliL protein